MFVVLLMGLHPTQELEPPANPAQFTEAAAHEINILVAYLFLPVDRVLSEDSAIPEKAQLGATERSAVLADAAEARNPLHSLRPFPEAQIAFAMQMGFRWPDEPDDDLGVPARLEDEAWFSLPMALQEELRQGLRQSSASLLRRVRRGTRVRKELDTFLLSLAFMYELGTDRADLGLELGLVSHSESRFLRLAELVLARLPALPSGRSRISVNQRTAAALATRWRRIRKAAAKKPI